MNDGYLITAIGVLWSAWMLDRLRYCKVIADLHRQNAKAMAVTLRTYGPQKMRRDDVERLAQYYDGLAKNFKVWGNVKFLLTGQYQTEKIVLNDKFKECIEKNKTERTIEIIEKTEPKT